MKYYRIALAVLGAFLLVIAMGLLGKKILPQITVQPPVASLLSK